MYILSVHVCVCGGAPNKKGVSQSKGTVPLSSGGFWSRFQAEFGENCQQSFQQIADTEGSKFVRKSWVAEGSR